MKKIFASIIAVALLAACGTTGTGTVPSSPVPIIAQTPQQIVTQACVLLPGILSILQVQEAAFPASVTTDIASAQKVVSGATVGGVVVPGICSAGFVADTASVQTLANTVMPVIVNAVELSPTITPQVKAEVAAAQGIFLLIQAQQAAQAGAASPVVAPVSTPMSAAQ